MVNVKPIGMLLILILTGCGESAVDLVTLEDAGGLTDPDAGATDADTSTGGDPDTATASDTGPGPDLVTATVVVPSGFDETPVRLEVLFFHELPPDGPPAGEGASFFDPAIGPGLPFDVVSYQAGLVGTHFLAVVLYVEGGGIDQPAPGIDWIGDAPFPILLGPGTGIVDAGTIELRHM